jgi:DNA-binding Xre family transcriptional regulator
MRGVDKMFSFLNANGFVHSTAYYLISGKVSNVKIAHIEKLCVLLNCTPNDLFEWKRDAQDNLATDHALNSLDKDDEKPVNVKALLKDIPIEKMPEIENLLKSLKDG